MLQGILPDTPAVDPTVAKKTADKVWEIWPDEDIRGWGRAVLAINSARIGDPERAVYHLTAFDWWKFDGAGMLCCSLFLWRDIVLLLITRVGFAIRGGDGMTPCILDVSRHEIIQSRCVVNADSLCRWDAAAVHARKCRISLCWYVFIFPKSSAVMALTV
jgi:hypothetical protein